MTPSDTDLEERIARLIDRGEDSTDEAFEAALDLARHIRGRDGHDPARTFDQLDADLGFELETWLHQVAWELGRQGRLDRVEAICRTYGELIDPVNFLGELGILLAQAGRRSEAVAQAESNLATMGGRVWTILNAGETFEELGEAAQAEQLYRQAQSMAADPNDREAAAERLQTLLRKQGRRAESHEPGPSPVPVAAEQRLDRGAKIGRNDPCPCGSVKKFKKCCGKT